MYCNNCYEEIPDGSTVCPKCLAQLTNDIRGKKKVRGFSFGGPKKKKKMKKSKGPLFDEEGNLIRYDDFSSDTGGVLDSDVGDGEYIDDHYTRGPNGDGQHKRDFRLNPIIVIILTVSLIVIIGIIVFTYIYMKYHKTEDSPNGPDVDIAATSETINEIEDHESSITGDSIAVTPVVTEVKDEENSGNNQASQQGETTEAAGKQNVEKSSFTQDTADSYFWPNSDSRLYTFEDLDQLNLNQIKLIKAEIYAREGCIFINQEYNDYFKKKNWYNGTVAEDKFDPGRLLNYYELENVRLIDTYIDDKW